MIVRQWLGRVSYRWAWRLQERRRAGVWAGSAPDTLWLLEHDPVVTLGRRAAHVDRALLDKHGVEVVQTERGGLATWHGPGQLVGYLIMDIGRRGLGTRALVTQIESGLIAWLEGQGVRGERRPSAPGVWVGDAKIAAIGLHVARGVTMHGFSLNLALPADAFLAIAPCGFERASVTDLARLTGSARRACDVADEVGFFVTDAIGGGKAIKTP